MKTTFDLPDELVREMKLRAILEGKKLKDVATEVVRRGLGNPASIAPAPGNRVKLPLIECARPAPGEELDSDQIAEVLSGQEADWSHEVARR